MLVPCNLETRAGQEPKMLVPWEMTETRNQILTSLLSLLSSDAAQLSPLMQPLGKDCHPKPKSLILNALSVHAPSLCWKAS